jgi:hypothetical protein
LSQKAGPESDNSYLTSYIQNKFEKMNEVNAKQRQMITNTTINRLNCLNKQKMGVLHTTASAKFKPANNLQASAKHLEGIPLKQVYTPVLKKLEVDIKPFKGKPEKKKESNFDKNNGPVVDKLRSSGVLTGPELSESKLPNSKMKDYKINDMFKMIKFIENDENLTNTKTEYRVGAVANPLRSGSSSSRRPPTSSQKTTSRPRSARSIMTTNASRNTLSERIWVKGALPLSSSPPR